VNASLVARPGGDVKRRATGRSTLQKRKAPANRGFAESLVRRVQPTNGIKATRAVRTTPVLTAMYSMRFSTIFILRFFVHCTIKVCALHINRPRLPTSA
jgi:hypothetical protein